MFCFSYIAFPLLLIVRTICLWQFWKIINVTWVLESCIGKVGEVLFRTRISSITELQGPLNSKKTGKIPRHARPSRLNEAYMGAAMWVNNMHEKKLFWTFIFHGQLFLTNMQSYRPCLPLTKDKKENCPKIRNLGDWWWTRRRS